ncbi:host-nuclease inhibitor Gam family protein [Rhodoferax aquaticus]|uniref:Host-nuclease inhibitor protein Gam n=1 Tax=Rhodoferax aquaticus TaxID=2527691 RepID=A0A515EKE6_9BURK|nr:host-nuclease inhibitor Gam family protein [Rhodoferax aquaticus]QDL53126.1 host-nuclease inhibitor protein Gam [Rhodoferax aquaticus]
MATRIKTKAADAPQTMAQVQSDIRKIGDLSREHGRVSADLNDKVAKLTDDAAPTLKDLQEQIAGLQKGVQIYCEANREELCGKGKTANLVTGEVQWRQRPPSVKVTGVDAVIAWLKNMGMNAFIRSKEEINKEAMLNEPEKAKGVPGVSIVTGVEDFVIVPFEVDTEVAA